MKKSLALLFALVFALSFGLANVASADAKADKAEAKAIAKACKDKKAGDVVKIKDKEVTCPEKKAMKKKSTPATPAEPAKK